MFVYIIFYVNAILNSAMQNKRFFWLALCKNEKGGEQDVRTTEARDRGDRDSGAEGLQDERYIEDERSTL